MIYKLILFFNLISFALSDYGGGYAGSGFRFGNNAREISLGGSLASEYNSGFNAFSNPAFLYKVNEVEFGSSMFAMSLDRSIQVISVSRALSRRAGTSLSFFKSGTKRISEISYNKDLLNSDLSFSDSYFMLSFGAGKKNFSIGFNLKAYLQSADLGTGNYDANGIGIDIGLYYKINRRLSLGAKFENIIGFINHKSGVSIPYEEVIPSRYIVSIRGVLNRKFTMFLSEEVMEINNDYYFRTNLSGEYAFNNFNIPIMIRLGLRQAQWTYIEEYEFKFNPCFGLGLNTTIFSDKVLHIDYAFDYGMEKQGISNLFSLTLEL